MKLGKRIALIALALLLGTLLYLRLSDGRRVHEESDFNEPVPVEQTPFVPETPPVELKAALSESDLKSLDCSALVRLDLTGSRCYEAIEAFINEHPDVDVSYAVILDGAGDPLSLDPETESITIDDASYLPSLTENAKWLKNLSSVSIEPDIADAAEVDALREACPECEVKYSMHLLGDLYPYDIVALTLTGLNAESLEQLIPQLERFSHLGSVSIPHDENDLSMEDALRISADSSVIQLDYQMELFGEPVSLDAESLEYENVEIGNDGLEELRAVLPYFRNLKYLKLDSCGVDNEHMAQLRDDFPEIKIVWRVFFGSYHCLTDTEMIWATGGSVNDNTSDPLKYCTDVKYLDLGHTLITHADFLNYMPKLEVAILAITWLNDISPIANCPNLEYLELFSARVSDLSPLAQCTHLQHLNISCQRNANNVPVGPTDISSLYDLPEIKRFYCTMSYVPESQQKEIMDRHPDCEFEFRWVDPAEGHWRFKDGMNNNVPENRVDRYALLYEQFGYATLQQSGKTWSLYG